MFDGGAKILNFFFFSYWAVYAWNLDVIRFHKKFNVFEKYFPGRKSCYDLYKSPFSANKFVPTLIVLIFIFHSILTEFARPNLFMIVNFKFCRSFFKDDLYIHLWFLVALICRAVLREFVDLRVQHWHCHERKTTEKLRKKR